MKISPPDWLKSRYDNKAEPNTEQNVQGIRIQLFLKNELAYVNVTMIGHTV